VLEIGPDNGRYLHLFALSYFDPAGAPPASDVFRAVFAGFLEGAVVSGRPVGAVNVGMAVVLSFAEEWEWLTAPAEAAEHKCELSASGEHRAG